MKEIVGKLLGGIGIVIGAIGLFRQSILMGVIAMIIGFIGFFTPQKFLSWLAVAVGAIAITLGLV